MSETPAPQTAAAGAPARILASASSVLVIDWPSREVPAALAAAGFTVYVKGGPGPADYAAWEPAGDDAVSRPLGQAPGRVDLVYCHRPFGELPAIIALAGQLGARALWWQAGLTSSGGRDPAGCFVPPAQSRQARELAGAAGLRYVDHAYIAAAVRAQPPRPPRPGPVST